VSLLICFCSGRLSRRLRYTAKDQTQRMFLRIDQERAAVYPWPQISQRWLIWSNQNLSLKKADFPVLSYLIKISK
jgi:hypothetical protein